MNLCVHTRLNLTPRTNTQAEGARGLAKGLAANATLYKLVLAWNGLEEGASALGDMLAANMGLKHLDLSHCRVSSEACMMLGEGLKSNVTLEVLLLSGNDRIGEDGARHLMVALAANRSLHFLGLNGSNMTCKPGFTRMHGRLCVCVCVHMLQTGWPPHGVRVSRGC